MDKEKRGRGGEDVPLLRARLAGLLNRLIVEGPPDGRIDIDALEVQLSGRLHDKNFKSALRRYIRGAERPKAAIAWHLGESLRELDNVGVAWASGFMMLYASGRLKDFAGVLLCTLYTGERLTSTENARAIRELLDAVDDLVIETDVDFEAELISIHRVVHDPQSSAVLLEQCFRRLDAPTDSGRKQTKREQKLKKRRRDVATHLFEHREHAKACWSRQHFALPALAEGFKRWFSEGEANALPVEWLPILGIAENSKLPNLAHEHVVLDMLQQCLTLFDDPRTEARGDAVAAPVDETCN